MQLKKSKNILLLAILGLIQTAAAQITDGSGIFAGGDIGTSLVNFLNTITLVQIDTTGQAALFLAVVGVFYFASLNIFEQVFLRLEEIIMEAFEGNSRGLHRSEEYPTGVKGMALAVAFLSANGLTGLIGLFAALAMGIIALLILLIIHGKLLGILSSFGLVEDIGTTNPTPTTTTSNDGTTPEPEPSPEPQTSNPDSGVQPTETPPEDGPGGGEPPGDINGPYETDDTMTESDSMEQAFQDLLEHLENEMGREKKELNELNDAKEALADALNQLLEHERLIDLAVQLEEVSFHKEEDGISGRKFQQELNRIMKEVGLEPGQEDQVLDREAALIDRINEDLHEAAMDLKDVLSTEQDEMQEEKGTLEELEKVEEHLEDLENAARSAERALQQ